MEISLLQSLIDRTSNEIAEYEACIDFNKTSLRLNNEDWETEQLKWAIGYFKKKIAPLRKIQKALKKEIAAEIGDVRWIKSVIEELTTNESM